MPANGNVIVIDALIAVLNTFHESKYEGDRGLGCQQNTDFSSSPLPKNSKHLSSYSPCLPIVHYFSPVDSSCLSCIILYIIFPSSLGVSPCIVGVSWHGLVFWRFLHCPSAVDVPSI